MKTRMHKDDGVYNTGIEIELDEALRKIENFPLATPKRFHFIGFWRHDGGDAIQFIRYGDDSWIIDVSDLKDKPEDATWQNHDLTTEDVKQITRDYFNGKDREELCEYKMVRRTVEKE